MNISSNCYSVLKVSELKQSLVTESRTIFDFDEQLSTNSAYIYYLKSGKVLLIPNDRSDSSEGIKFDSKGCYQGFLQNDSFPIENPDSTVYEKFQPEIVNVKNQITNMINELNQAFNLNCQITEDIDNISTVLLKMKGKKTPLKYRLYVALLLGEYLRKTNNGNWILIKRYGTYNPYYVPGILYSKENYICLIMDDFGIYESNVKRTPYEFVNLPFIKKPAFKLKHISIKKYSNPYKIL